MINILGRKPLSLIATAVALTMGLTVSVHAQTVLFDFGSNTSFRGLSVPNPDANGNHWNSFQPGLFYQNLIDTTNSPTTIDFGFSTPVATDSYNGPAGPTTTGSLQFDVTFTEVDAEALGILGGGCTGLTGTCEGVFDFAASDPNVPVRFEIQELDPTKSYSLTFFGSHKYSIDNTTVYNIYSDNTYTTLIATTSLDHQDPSNPALHNQDKVVTIAGLTPQASNILYVEFAGDQGSNGYLNAMLLEAVAVALQGDFNNDSRVDGRDFLDWQRNPSVGNLTDWQANYGAGSLASFAAVPEPASMGLIILASVGAICLRRPPKQMA